MGRWVRAQLHGRPWWMNAMMFFCFYMTFVYVPWDLFVKPVAEDKEVWFGVLFSGWTAKALTPFHWLVYGLGAYGFRKMRPWMHPWAGLYVLQIGVGSLVWFLLYGTGGSGPAIAGVAAFVVFAAIAWVLWRARPLFQERPPTRERYGEWALVTGASAGIGEAFARALAAEGMSCVLTARRQDRLEALASELEREHGVATRCIAVDLAAPDGAAFVADSVADLEIGVLVNNAGAGYAGSFAKQDGQRLNDMVQLNCAAPVALTSLLLPAMRERRRGAVIVVGSVAGHQPLPYHAVYAATKAFDLLFGEALHAELKGDGVDVIVLEPGPTATEFQDVAGEIAHPGEPPENTVRATLDALGRQPSVVSGWVNWGRSNASRFLPRSATPWLAAGVMEKQTPKEMM